MGEKILKSSRPRSGLNHRLESTSEYPKSSTATKRTHTPGHEMSSVNGLENDSEYVWACCRTYGGRIMSNDTSSV